MGWWQVAGGYSERQVVSRVKVAGCGEERVGSVRKAVRHRTDDRL